MTTPNGDRWKQRGPKVDEMQRSSITGDRFKAGGMIPLPPGQNVKFIPVHHKQGHEIEVLDMKSGERRKVFIDDQMLKNIIDPRWHQLLPDVPPELRRAVWFAGDDEEYEIDATTLTDLKRRAVQKFSKIPSDLGSFPRPNCPTCATPNPQLHTPLDNGSPSGWGDSFFECTNWKCRKKWLWRKSFPLLAENHNKEGTVTGTLIRGLNIPFHLFGQTGATIEQVNDAVRKIANVAGIASMGQKEQIALQQIIQEGACKTIDPELAKVTDEIRGPHANNGPRLYP